MGSSMDFDAVLHAGSQAGRCAGMGPRAWFDAAECQAPDVAGEVIAAASRFATATAAVDSSLLALDDAAQAAVTVKYETDQAVAREFTAAVAVAVAFRV